MCRSKSVHDVSSGSNDTDGACGYSQCKFDNKEYFIKTVNRNAVRNISHSLDREFVYLKVGPNTQIQFKIDNGSEINFILIKHFNWHKIPTSSPIM